MYLFIKVLLNEETVNIFNLIFLMVNKELDNKLKKVLLWRYFIIINTYYTIIKTNIYDKRRN